MSNTENLKEALSQAAEGLPKTGWKRMFGCDAVFADSTIFGLVWKTGRIGVRLPDEAEFTSLMKVKGAAPWKAGKMTMSHWVLVPEPFHGENTKLTQWVRKAHALALLNPKASKTKRAASPHKKKRTSR